MNQKKNLTMLMDRQQRPGSFGGGGCQAHIHPVPGKVLQALQALFHGGRVLGN